MIPTLQSLRQLLNRPVRALDHDFGSLYNVYLIEGSWRVGYFVIQTGSWLEDRRVLISPLALRTPFWLDNVVHVDLTRQEIIDSPPTDAAKPVSRKQEELMNAYFGWPSYWRPAEPAMQPAEDLREEGNAELRSLRELLTYAVACKDSILGTVDDFIGDEPDWTVPYLVAETGGVLSRRRFVPAWLIDRIEWARKTVFVNANLRQIMDGPSTDHEVPDAEFRALLERYFRKPAPALLLKKNRHGFRQTVGLVRRRR